MITLNALHTIGNQATRAGVSIDTPRYYEQERLLEPAAKTAAGYRQYNDDAVRRARFIKTSVTCPLPPYQCFFRESGFKVS